MISEVAWSRALGQTLGGSLASQAIVLGVFLAGLAAGSALAGRISIRLQHPLRSYVWLETGVAFWALLSPLFARLAERLVALLGPGVPDGAPLVTLRLAAATLVLVPPTLAMGATLPMLVRAWPAGDATRALPLLYGLNTVGAAGGALLGAFAFLPLLGTRGTFAAGAVLHLAAAATVARIARRAGRAVTTRSTVASQSGTAVVPPSGLVRVTALAALSGIVGALLQFGWARVMTLGFGSSIYALGLTLAAFLLGLGLGPLLTVRFVGGGGQTTMRAASAAAWMVGLASLAILPLLGGLPRAAASLSRLYQASPAGALAVQFIAAALLMLVPAMAQGACLPLLAALDAGRRPPARAAGRIYSASTVGAVLGFLLAGFVLVPAVGTRRTLACASAGALLLSVAVRPRPRAAVILLAAAPLVLLSLPGWDGVVMSGGGFLYGPLYRAALPGDRLGEAIRRRGTILFEREDGDALVTVRRSAAGVLSLQINGKTEASSGADMATQLLAAHLPLLLHPGAREVMVVGLASGVTLGAALRHPVDHVRVVEIGRAVPSAARVFDAVHGRALDDPRVELIADDARGYLLARADHFDVITSQPSNPWVAGVANLFTEDFYRLVRSRLKPGGVFCQWVQAYRISPEDLRGVVRAFLLVFPDATLWEESAGGGDYFLVGGVGGRIHSASLIHSPHAVWDDLRRAGIEGPTDLLARFVAGPGGLASFADQAPPHTDDDLYLEWRAPLSLFRDTWRVQTDLLRRDREPVTAVLEEGALESDPAFRSALRESLRRRDARLAAAADLRDADLLALREPHLTAGLDLLRGGRYAEAATALSGAAIASPDSASAHWLLGEAYRGAGLVEPAAVAYARAVAIDPGIAPAWNGLGLAALATGRLDEARGAFAAALRAAPGLATARNNLGTVLLRQGDLPGAEREFRSAAEDDPGLAATRANLGLVARRRGDNAAAERGYREALALDPLNTDARFNLAVILRESGRRAEAVHELERILAIDPGDDDARAALATSAR